MTNPKSSNASRVSKRLSRLERKLGATIDCVPTSKNPAVFRRRFKNTIREHMNHPTVVLIGGGDGTVHEVMTATIAADIETPENIILLPIWGGNANDFAYMLNGLGLQRDLYTLINRARPVKIHPLEIRRTNGKREHVDYAICYASFGASAFAADVIDKDGPARKGRFSNIGIFVLLTEMIHVVGALLHTPPFRAQVNGERVEIFEQVFTNGSRIAKVDRLPVNLTDKAFYSIAQPSKHPRMIFRIFKLLTGRQVGTVTDKPATFQVKEAVLGQYDGEVIKIAKNTTISIRISDTFIYALSTKLSN